MEKVMDRLKQVFRGALATSAVLCLVTFGVAQDQGSTTTNQSTTSTKSSKHKSKATSSDSASTDSSSSSGQLSASDKKFVMEAAQGGLAEVQMGQLAAQKGQSDQVKQFGQKMVDDHGKANDQLKQVAQQKGVTLPTDVSAKDKADMDKLSGLSGDAFDKAYAKHMVMDHKKDVAEFKKESTSGKDNDIKNWATQTLPTLQGHLKMAQQMASSTGGSASGSKGASKKSGSATSGGSQQ
jgi:putative membrane protein